MIFAKRLSKHGKSSEERNHTVVTHNPFMTKSLLEEDVELVTEAAVVAKHVEGKYPASIRVYLLLCALMRFSTG
jgi:hypothetical protein